MASHRVSLQSKVAKSKKEMRDSWEKRRLRIATIMHSEASAHFGVFRLDIGYTIGIYQYGTSPQPLYSELWTGIELFVSASISILLFLSRPILCDTRFLRCKDQVGRSFKSGHYTSNPCSSMFFCRSLTLRFHARKCRLLVACCVFAAKPSVCPLVFVVLVSHGRNQRSLYL